MTLWGSRPDLPAKANDHFDGKRFFNSQRSQKRFGDVFRWLAQRSHNVAWGSSTSQPATTPSVGPPPAQSRCLRVTWINHSTVLIQANGCNILTDPVYSDRVSPFRHLGPRRHHAPGVAFDALPRIDIVLISHAHYDHLDKPTISALIDRDDPLFLAGLGLQRWFERCGSTRVTTIDWWSSVDLDPEALRVTGVPARHWSRRGLFDLNRSLWLGYWLDFGSAGTLYFAGDTGYGPHFTDIQARLGSPRVALLPIGAYEPRWFMAPQHMNPADAVTAHRELGAQHSIGIHFGTFKLTDEGRDAPAIALADARRDQRVDAGRFYVPEGGVGYGFGEAQGD